ncbi:MAG: hypothetical protein KBS91_02915 [Firmicutes bacterium]|nr:hypothetical protein [Candidatus Caballimonas caccae]
MKMAKSKKIIILLVSFALLLTMFFMFCKNNEVKASEPTIKLTSTTFKIDGDNITLVDGYKYKKGSSDLYAENTNVGPVVKYTFNTDDDAHNDLSFTDLVNVTLEEQGNEFVFIITDKTQTASAKLRVDDDVKVYNISIIDDTTAPVYDTSTYGTEKNTYLAKLEENLKVEVEGKTYHKPLGSNKYITLPSMKAFVSDDTTPYEEMTYTVYYKNSKSDTSYSSGSTKVGKEGSDSFKIPVEVAGNYSFYVVFKDAHGNEMNKDDVSSYTFEFNILEDYPVQVKVSSEPLAKGYLNVLYKLGTSVFDVSDNTIKGYKLEYAVEENGTYIDVTNDSEIKFSTSDLSFTPTKKGFYKVTCTATSNSTPLKNTGFVTVEVSDESTVINKPDSPFVAWIKGHVVSVVFLCLGFLCLVGIIVLLFIKPKEDDEEPIEKETKKTKNKNE